MKLRTIFILWGIAICLGISVYLIKKSQNESITSTTKRAAGQTLLESFPAESVSSIHISGSKSSVNLAKENNSWTVRERDNFPANIQNINQFLRDVSELKITQGIKAGLSFAPRFGMDESSSDPENHGLTATFQDSSGKEIAKISLGKGVESSSQSSPFGSNQIGRYVRNHADSSGFYAVSELFNTISDDPKSWLKDDFLTIQRIQTVSVTEPGTVKIDWELSRPNETAEFEFTDAFPGVKASTQETSSLKSLLSFGRFEDVVPSSEIESRSTPDKIQKAIIKTFDNITYELTVQPAKSTQQEPDQPTSENFLVSFTISGEPPSERAKIENETEEAAQIADKAFNEKRDILLSQIEKHKKLVGRTFEIDRFTIDALLKNRLSLIDKGPGPQDTPPNEIPTQPAPEAQPQE